MLFEITLKTAQANGKVGRTVLAIDAKDPLEAIKKADERMKQEMPGIPYRHVGTPKVF